MPEELISTSVHYTLPESYVRSEADLPRLDEVVPDANIPVVDLAHPDRAEIVSQTGAACRSHSFLQVLNHGVPVELMQAAMAVANDFFRLSPEEKAKLYSDDPAKKMRLSTSFNVRKETVHNWRDYLRLHCHPLEQSAPDMPANPPPFRYQPDQGLLDRSTEEAGCSHSSGGGGSLTGPPSPEPVMKPDNDITIFLARKLANMIMTPIETANVDTSTGLPEVSANIGVTSPKLTQEETAGVDDTSVDLEVGFIRQIMKPCLPHASAPTREQVTTSLFVVSSFKALFGLTAMFNLPAAGPVFGRYKDSYYIILAIVLAAAAVELGTAYWLACSRGRRILSFAKVVLPVAYLLLLVVFAIGGFVIPFGKVLPAR